MTATCQALERCYAQDLALVWGDLARCIERNRPLCVATLALPGNVDTPATMMGCAQAITTMSCADFLANGVVRAHNFQPTARLPDACKPVGAQQLNASCVSGAQCASGYCASGSSTCGSCDTRVGSGASCWGAPCDDGLVCSFSELCQPLSGEGGHCNYVNDCAGDLSCANSHCTTGLLEGAACDPAADPCDWKKGFQCNQSTRLCARSPFAVGGQPCGLVDNMWVSCEAWGSCAGSGNTGTCAGAIADGQPCTSSGARCLPPSSCSNTTGVCTYPDVSSCHG